MPQMMRDQFWWRPGWAPGRAYLTWHLLPGETERAEATRVTAALAGIEHLAPVPARWLHVTGPGVGFADEVDDEAVAAMVAAAAVTLADVVPFDAALAPVRVGAGGVGRALCDDRLAGLRHTLRRAVRAAGLKPPGADDEEYRPHLTLAYATGPARIGEVARHLPPERPASFRVEVLHLLALRMVPPVYEWTVRAVVRLGGEPDLRA